MLLMCTMLKDEHAAAVDSDPGDRRPPHEMRMRICATDLELCGCTTPRYLNYQRPCTYSYQDKFPRKVVAVQCATKVTLVSLQLKWHKRDWLWAPVHPFHRRHPVLTAF